LAGYKIAAKLARRTGRQNQPYADPLETWKEEGAFVKVFNKIIRIMPLEG